MKRSILRHKYALWLVAALTLASCSQDELVDDNRLPEGKYPVVIQATGLQAVATPASRATVDGDWQGVTSVAVQVGTDVREYNTVTTSDADGYKTATLKSSNPFAEHEADYRQCMVAIRCHETRCDARCSGSCKPKHFGRLQGQ